MIFFGLKSGQHLKNWAAHPHQEFPGIPTPGSNLHAIEVTLKLCQSNIKSVSYGFKQGVAFKEVVTEGGKRVVRVGVTSFKFNEAL